MFTFPYAGTSRVLSLIICMGICSATYALATVKEHMWQLCLTLWELASLVALMELDRLSSLCGSTCCKPEPHSLPCLFLARAR
ncbi:hypothetical protein JB92DRAFT_83928 [Gautieria morchelliformis]|nr:hypothetical protein JB92DRAFT_83928 [Gautieria morchelliformis]